MRALTNLRMESSSWASTAMSAFPHEAFFLHIASSFVFSPSHDLSAFLKGVEEKKMELSRREVTYLCVFVLSGMTVPN